MAQNFDWFFGETPSTTKTNNQSSYGGFFDDQAVQPQEESGFFTNVAKGAADRSAELTGNFFEFLNTLNQSAEEKLYQMGLNIGFEPDEDGNYKFARNVDPNLTQNMADPVVDLLETTREVVGYDPSRGVDWEEYKDDWTSPKKLASFVVEQGVKSTPDMVATLTALPLYIFSRTQEIAESREVNKTYDPATNTFIDDPDGKVTTSDLAEALPSAVAVALVEKFGAKSIFTPKPGDTLKKRVARGASREGATEFVQENIEYGGEVLGTPVDYDLKTGLDRGFAGLVAGAGIGGPLAAGDYLLRGDPLADAVDQGRQDAQSKGGDGLDQATEAAGNAAAVRLNRQRARMGLKTEPVEVLIDPADLAGTTAENPIAVVGNTATINTPSGTTTIEMDTAQQALEAAQALQARSATPIAEDPLSVPGTLRSRLERDYPRAFAIPTVSVKDYLDGTKDFRTLGVPDLETLLDIYTIRTRRGAAPAPVIEPQTRQPLTPLGSPTNDPLQSLADTIILNERDMAAADAAGDFAGADALYEDIVRLRSAETALRRANTLAQNGDKEASDAIINRVMPVLQEEAGRRQAAMVPVQVQSDPLLLEDQGIIFAEGSTEPLNLPARVTKLKSNGTAYPTQKAAEAAMTRVSRDEPEYNWSVKRASGGFALEGNLPNTRAVNEKISPAVFEAATNRISQDFESAENRISQNAEDQRLMGQAAELEAIAEGSSEVSISDQLAAYESELSETTATLNALQARLAAETKRDQRGVLVKNPIQRAMTIKDTDDLLLTIVKLGGINIEDASGNGFEPALDNPKSNSVGAYRLFKKDGMTFDELREALQERGWYSQEDPNRPSVLGANEVMEDIREAVTLAQDNEFVYKGDKQAEIEFLKRDISFAEESLSELEGIVSSYKSQLSPEEAGRTDFIGITDSDVLNSINYFDEVQGAFNEDRAYPQEGAETVGGDSQAIDTGGVRGVESGATGVQRVNEELPEASSQASDGATRPDIQDRGLDPGGETLSAANQTEPSGSVSRSGPDGFELESYTESDITSLENRDIDALDRQEQLVREGENFALSGGDATVATGSDRMQNTQGNDLFSQQPAQTDNSGRAKPGGEYGLNGEFYQGGQFMPASARTKKGEYKFELSDKPGLGRELIAPGEFAVPPPGKRSIYGSMLRVFTQPIRENGELTDQIEKNKNYSDEVIFNNSGLTADQLQTYINAFNDGVRFVRRDKGEVLSTEEGLNRLDEAVSERLGESDTAFSVRQGATRNIPIITDEELDTVFKRVTGKDRNDSNSIFVVPSYSDLPQDIRDRAENMGHPPSDVRGVFHRGSIYVVRNQIKGKNDFEQVLLHEATHGGFRDMLGDRGVNAALNKLFASMGGREGFEQTLIDLGIEADLQPYKDSLDKEGGSVDRRNAILLDEMLAFTGQKGSKGIKLRIQELIGAIRAWLAKNGYVNLSKTRASDIALMARRARENYFANSTDRNDTAFSLAQRKARAQKNDQGLYSNAEQTILDEGDKIFKASKKNPDASVRGDQILSFLKGRGIKKDELQYTRLEQFLTEPLLAQAIADPKNAKPRRYTQEEVIAYLRSAAPQFSEEGVDVEGGVEQEIEWDESEVLEDTDYYTHIYENNIDEARNDDWEYGAADIVSKIMKDYPDEFMSMLMDQGINASDVGSVETIANAFEDQDKSLYKALQENFESEMEDAAWETARLDYMNNPVTETDAYFNNGQSYISIKGNEDYGYTVTIDGDMVSSEAIYDLDEAKVQAVNSLYEDGYLVDNGGTRFFDYLGIERDEITNYREIKQQLLENSMTSDYKDYEGGHWDGSNILYHTLVTDRSWAAGDTFVIEELQSDWHNDIRKKGGAYDPVRRAAAKDALDRAEKIAQDALAGVEETIKSIRDAAASKYPNLRGEIRAQDVETYANYKAKNIFSKKGFEKIESIKYGGQEQTPEFYNKKFLEAFMPGAIPELWFSEGDLERTIEADEEAGRFGIPNAEASPFTPEEISEARSLFTPEVLEAGRRRKEMFKRGNMGDSGLDYRTVRSLLPISWWGEMKASDTYGELRRRENILNLGIQDRLFGDNPEGIRNYLIEKELLDAARNGVQTARGELRDAESAPPDSPFRDDRYLELAAKRAIIQAVSENKDAIAFSKADRVQRRWSANFDYEAIYNKKLRKIMDKTMGQTPQSLDTNGEIDDSTSEGFWSYEITPELREEIEYEGLPMFSLRPEEGSIRIPSKGETKIADKFIKGLQDKFLPIKRLQQSIEETRGRKLFEEEDAYLAEEMFYGKTEEDLRQIELEFVEPLMKDMESSGISVKELDDFLMAKHAPERNREVAKINAALPDGGSGLTTREANEHLASVAEDPQKLANLERLAGRVYEMTTLTRELLVNGGLISEEEVSSWDSKYQFYVPLKGFADNELNDQGFAIRTGKGYEIQGKESRRALGRRSKADSPLVQVISDLTEKTIRNRKNEVGQSLLTLAENNPDSMFWKVFTADNPDTKDTWNAQANRVVTGPVDMARDDRYFGVKRDGKAYYIRIEDERILDTMRKVGPQAQGALINMMGAATRWLSFVNTAANPEFVITNFARDIQAAGINILAEQSKDGGRIEGEELAARAVNLKNVGGAVAAIAEYHRNKRTQPKAGNEYQQYYQEFMETGGKTGFFDSPDLDKIAKDLNGRLQESGTGKKVKEVGKNILDFVTDYNTAVENGIRLSTYVEARKVGLSAKKASSLAKNLTVNFNRKGDHGQVLNSAYMFFNAAVQGLAQFSVTMSPFQVDSKGDWKLQRKVNTAQKVAGGIVVSAAMLANVNRLVGGEDDDGEAYWDKVSPAIRERNIVFMKPDGSGEYYKFPLPYGYNFFYNLGDVLEGSVYGSARRKPKLMSQAIESFITAFSPMALHSADSLSERLFISATPSIAVPASELVTNTNFFGGDIKREPNPYGAQRAASHNYWSTTKGPYIAIAKFMNDTVGGGSSYKSGSVDPLGFMFDADVLDINTDVSPDTLEHLLEYSLGGIYRTGTGVAEAANRYFSGREVDAATVPFINKLVGRDTSDFSDRSNYYDIRQEITNARTEYRDSDNKREAVETHNGLHLLYRSTLQVDKRLARLREQEDRARDSKRLSARERDDKLFELREEMDDEIDRFYVKYRNHLSRRAEKQ